MSPEMSPAIKLSLARAKRDVTQSQLNTARREGTERQVEQLSAALRSLDEQIAELESDAPLSLPHRKDTDD